MSGGPVWPHCDRHCPSGNALWQTGSRRAAKHHGVSNLATDPRHFFHPLCHNLACGFVPKALTKKHKPLEVKIILIGRPGDPIHFDGLDHDVLCNDHVAVLPAGNVRTVPSPLESLFTGPGQTTNLAVSYLESLFIEPGTLTKLAIICPLDRRVDVTPILDVAKTLKAQDCNLDLQGAYVSGTHFERLVREWTDVALVGCAIGPGWWKSKGPESVCRVLVINSCTVSPSREGKIGRGSWPTLEWLWLNEDVFDRELQSKGAINTGPIPSHQSKWSRDTSPLMRCLWNGRSEDTQMRACRDVSVLTGLPPSDNLHRLDLSESPLTEEVFDWIVSNRNLTSIDLSWRPGFRIPWHKLKKLRKLRSLGVVGTTFSDADLAKVAQATRLRCLTAYYTDLTPASWPLAFSMPSLGQIWVSVGMLEGALPAGLPETTKLKEVVALNVGPQHMEYLRRLLERYPNVKMFEM